MCSFGLWSDSRYWLAVHRCLEIGSGSGYVICSVALLLEHFGIHGKCIAVDINPAACSCTQQTLRNHEVSGARPISCSVLVVLPVAPI